MRIQAGDVVPIKLWSDRSRFELAKRGGSLEAHREMSLKFYSCLGNATRVQTYVYTPIANDVQTPGVKDKKGFD